MYSRARTLADYQFTDDDMKDLEKRRKVLAILKAHVRSTGRFEREYKGLIDNIQEMPWENAVEWIKVMFQKNFEFS